MKKHHGKKPYDEILKLLRQEKVQIIMYSCFIQEVTKGINILRTKAMMANL